jgi:uncharacterized protein with NAD-binding domain and iron-sulfur cluster
MTAAMTKAPATPWNGPRVAVFGAGVAGMTAAHELAERGFRVDLYEASTRVGGKAATQYAPFTDGAGSSRTAPAEHGFRLFPAFYRHVIDTMRRIPFDRVTPPFSEQGDAIPALSQPVPPPPPRRYITVADNLMPTTVAAVARPGLELREVPRAGAGTVDGFLGLVERWFDGMLGFDDVWSRDVARFQLRLLQFLTSCDDRRMELDAMSWLGYVSGGNPSVYSPTFRRHIAAFIRTMVAMDAYHGSAYTVGRIAMQMLLDVVGDGATTDRVLNGPTSHQWLVPWMNHLRRIGVRLHGGARLTGLTVAGHQVTGAEVTTGATATPVVADYYVLALPAQAVRERLLAAGVTPQSAASLEWLLGPSLASGFAWLSGAQFYLRSDVPMVTGHTYFPDAPWGLSTVSQGQLWGASFGDDYGDQEFHGILSVDISDWDTPGRFVTNRPAREVPVADDICREIWAQLKDSLRASRIARLRDEDLYGWHLDENIITADRGAVGATQNLSPHFIHPVGSRTLRPGPTCEIANLLLAGDYVRTATDLATMEAANEAGRLCANALMARAGAPAAPCALFHLSEPHLVDGLKAIDQRLVAHGDPHLFEILGIEAVVAGLPSISISALRTLLGSQTAGELAGNLLSIIPTASF